MTLDLPEINGLMWRGIYSQDEQSLKALDTACKAADGDEPVSNLTGDALKAAAAHGDNALCVTAGDDMAASAWVLVEPPEEDAQRIVIGGKVHPDFRRHGIGETLIAWAESRALSLASPDKTLMLTITNEALTEDATALYLDYGYENTMTEFMLTRPLDEPLPEVILPEGLKQRRWESTSAPLFFRAYAEGFDDRLGGIVPVKETWIAEYAEQDEHFRPDLSRVILEGGRPVAFVTCEVMEKTGWIAQIAVVQERRRKGLARALLLQAMSRFKAEGCSEAVLHVNANNPGAMAVFFEAGFIKRLARARFVKKIMAAA